MNRLYTWRAIYGINHNDYEVQASATNTGEAAISYPYSCPQINDIVIEISNDIILKRFAMKQVKKFAKTYEEIYIYIYVYECNYCSYP